VHPGSQLICPQLVKDFPLFYATRRFITTLTSAHNIETQRPFEMFCIFMSFNGEEWLAPHPTLKLEGTPCRLYASLYSIYSQLSFRIWRPSLHSQSENASCCGDGDPLIIDFHPYHHQIIFLFRRTENYTFLLSIRWQILCHRTGTNARVWNLRRYQKYVMYALGKMFSFYYIYMQRVGMNNSDKLSGAIEEITVKIFS
jgi:hypothetical protein